MGSFTIRLRNEHNSSVFLFSFISFYICLFIFLLQTTLRFTFEIEGARQLSADTVKRTTFEERIPKQRSVLRKVTARMKK